MFTAHLVNFFATGYETTKFNNGGWSLNLIPCKLGKYGILIEQDPSVASNKIKAQGVVPTSKLHIRGVKSYDEGIRVTKDICNLLSLASMSPVCACGYEYQQLKKKVTINFEAQKFRPLIQISNGMIVKSFLETTWVQYRKLKRSRKLSEIFHMLTTSELPNIPLEVKLGQMFIILENLKSTYAQFNKIPFISGYFREISTPPKLNPKKEKTLGFEFLLKDMFKSVGMNVRLTRIIKLRNEIVHFGLSRKKYSTLWNNYEFCQVAVREYLLKLLCYKGEYLLYSDACNTSLRIE